ncbi:MAG: hypothetical protein U9O94_05740, partial [Nanoarchaeota archaeon]|nr:hypothetical protein [Nanoarchaeota archaeon]
RPLDLKQMCTTAERLSLTFVQRHIGMITYDTDLNKWKTLINNPAGDTTVEVDWEDFGGDESIERVYLSDNKTVELRAKPYMGLLSNLLDIKAHKFDGTNYFSNVNLYWWWDGSLIYFYESLLDMEFDKGAGVYNDNANFSCSTNELGWQTISTESVGGYDTVHMEVLIQTLFLDGVDGESGRIIYKSQTTSNDALSDIYGWNPENNNPEMRTWYFSLYASDEVYIFKNYNAFRSWKDNGDPTALYASLDGNLNISKIGTRMNFSEIVGGQVIGSVYINAVPDFAGNTMFISFEGQEFSGKEVDYIIGSDEKSIDELHKDMSIPDRELITRGYADQLKDCPIKYTTLQSSTTIPHEDGVPMFLAPDCSTVSGGEGSEKLWNERIVDLEALVLSGGIIELTITELRTLQQAQELDTTKRYLANNYQTIYNQPESNVVMTGNSERILFTPTSNETFDESVQSLDYPTDIIHLDFDNDLCEDGTTSRHGLITYRRDIIQELSTYYDWRNIKFRRYDIASINNGEAWANSFMFGYKAWWTGNLDFYDVTVNASYSDYEEYYTFTYSGDLNNPTGGGYMRDIHIGSRGSNNIAHSEYYANVVIYADSVFTAQQCSGVKFEGDVYGVHVGRIQDSTFKTKCREWLASEIQDMEVGSFAQKYFCFNANASKIGNRCNQFVFESIQYGYIGNGSHTWHSEQLRNVRIKPNISFQNTVGSTIINDSGYDKTVFKRQDGTARLSYFDNSDIEQIVNVDA